MARLDPTTWLDEQRRGTGTVPNVFRAILAEAQAVRQDRWNGVRHSADQRMAQVEHIRQAAAKHDAAAERGAGSDLEIPNFSDMAQRWKGLR